jgi:uncharacterized membrane protein
MLYKSNITHHMKIKTFKTIKLIMIIISAMVFSEAIILKNYYIPIAVIIIIALVLFILRRQVKEIIADERDFALAGKAGMIATQFFSWVAVIVMFILYAQRDYNPYYEPVGAALAFSVCFLMLVYVLAYYYLSGAKPLKIIVSLILTIIIVLAGIRFFSGEDDWICQNGSWIKHGNPDFPAPITECK